MAKIIIEIDDEVIADALSQIVSSGTSKTAKPSGKAAKAEPEEEEEDYTPADIKEMCAELKELTDAKTLKEVLSEYDVTTPAKAMKLEDDDLQDLGEDLAEAIDEASDGEEAEEEITVDAVKEAVQAYTKSEGKEASQEILEEYNIKSVRGLNKLDADDLAELFAAVTE